MTDILFYSSDSKSIQKYRSSGEYQGVYFAIRDENKDEITPSINRLIEKLIKRSNTPAATRGIVLGCVAELDNIIKQKIIGFQETMHSLGPLFLFHDSEGESTWEYAF